MKAVVRTCACAISLDHLDFRLFMFGSHSYSKSGWIYCQFYFETEVRLPIFRGSSSNLKLMQNLFHLWGQMLDSLLKNQDEFTVSFSSRRKFIFLFFEEAVQIWSLCEFSWLFGLKSWCTGSILESNFYLRKQISLPINEGSC